MIADAGIKYKKMRHISHQDEREQKANHAAAIRQERQIKKLATLIKNKKLQMAKNDKEGVENFTDEEINFNLKEKNEKLMKEIELLKMKDKAIEQ